MSKLFSSLVVFFALGNFAAAAQHEAWSPSQKTAVNPSRYPANTFPKDSWSPGSNRSLAAESNSLPIARILSGIAYRQFASTSISMVQFGYAHYQSEQFFIGGRIAIGQISAPTGNYTEGAMLAGFLAPVSSTLNVLLMASFGAAAGNITGGLGSTMFSFDTGIELAVGPTVRALIGPSYTFTPASSALGGFGAFLRIEFLRF